MKELKELTQNIIVLMINLMDSFITLDLLNLELEER